MRIKEQQLTEDYIKATLDTIQLLNENKLTDMAKSMGKKLLAQLGIPAGKDYSELVNIFASKAEKSVQVLKSDIDILRSGSAQIENAEELAKQLENLMNQISSATTNLKATVPPADMIDKATDAAAESAGEEQEGAEVEPGAEGEGAEGTEGTEGAEAVEGADAGTDGAVEGEGGVAEGGDGTSGDGDTADGADAAEGGDAEVAEGDDTVEGDGTEGSEPAGDADAAEKEPKADDAEADDADKEKDEVVEG